ncbi:MAG: efflux RND transporter permease subunit, partial [Phycisphaerae bacterium]|nr:efflux RND transporter permease subunit [Phycisphaerae bacterium]
MDIIKWSIERPVSVTVGVLLVVLFGLIGVTGIPIQLTPTVDRPIITVSTSWPGRSPQEIVDEITKEQEERLKNVKNLKTMRSVSQEGTASITLEFYIGSDLTRALQEVSDALRQVPDYPDEVDEPTIQTSEGSVDQAIAWVIIDVDPAKADKHPGYDISTLFTPMDREVKPFLERIDGVAQINIYGGREKEVRVLLDPTRLAQRGLSHRQVIDALRAENANVSAGTIAEGKRDYRVRVTGQFTSPEEVLDTIIAYRAP